MRLRFKTLVAAAAACLATPVLAQTEAPANPAPSNQAPAPAASSASTPAAPIPYSRLNSAPRPARPAAAPRVAAPASPPTAQPAPPAPPPAPSGARLAPGAAIPSAELEAFVDGVVGEAMDRDHIAGVTVSVVQNGQVVLKKGYGFADLSPARKVDPDRTLFRVGSISKTFTWIALMKEIEAGRIREDAPINLYLPERVQVRDQGYRVPVRVQDLMDHSAGFEDRALGQLFEREPGRVRPLVEYLRQERPSRVRPPGASAVYSNYGAALAGEAVSYVAGKPFERLIEETILLPAGMTSTSFREPRATIAGLPAPLPAALAAEMSVGYRWAGGAFSARPFEYIGQVAPAGSASSTAADMARYMQLLLNGGVLDGRTIYGPRAAQAFRTPLRKTPPGINGWPHGFIAYTLPGGHAGFGHAGATLSFLSNMVVAPDLNLGVFVSTNTETGRDLADSLPGQIVQQFYVAPRPFPKSGSPALAARAGDFAGYYLGDRRAYGGLEGLVGLAFGGVRVSVSPDGLLVVSGRGETRAYAPDGDLAAGRFVAASGSDRLAFTFEDGRARGFQTGRGEQTFQRAPFWRQPSTMLALAAMTGLAALATIGGVFVRNNRREFRETSIQRQASLLQSTQAVLWLAAFGLFALWGARASDTANIMYVWPGAPLLVASACMLVAAALAVGGLLVLPGIWRGGRRVDSWTSLRKTTYSFTALLYGAFSLLLGLWGALSPWSG